LRRVDAVGNSDMIDRLHGNQEMKTMARPIEPTPILRGEDAERFIAAANNPKPFEPPEVDNADTLEAIKQRHWSGNSILLPGMAVLW